MSMQGNDVASTLHRRHVSAGNWFTDRRTANIVFIATWLKCVVRVWYLIMLYTEPECDKKLYVQITIRNAMKLNTLPAFECKGTQKFIMLLKT